MPKLPAEAYAIIEGHHSDPFHYLGLHPEDGKSVVRAFLPEASDVEAVGEHGEVAILDRVHDAGLFVGALPNGSKRYQLRAQFGDNVVEFEDAYRFPPILTDFDLYLLGEGTHQRLYDKLGAHPMTLDGVDGVGFVVFAPNARRVSVVGDFNFWDARRHAMRVRGNGYWEMFIPHAKAGDQYKYDIVGPHGHQLPLKSDPMAFAAEVRPKTASIVFDEAHLARPRPALDGINALSAPMSIYEVHLGSWRRKSDNEWLTYRELAEQLPTYARDMGFTHLELMPVSEHPFDGSWGYQPTGLYAPTSRFGTPEDFAALVDACHRKASPCCSTGYRAISRTIRTGSAAFRRHRALRARQPDAGPSSRLGHADLQLRPHRSDELPGGERAVLARALRHRRPARRCGRFDALSRLQPPGRRLDSEPVSAAGRTSTRSRSCAASTRSCSRDSRRRPPRPRNPPPGRRCRAPVDLGGLGFGYKWNMGWMHDTLNYISKDPIHRKHHHGDILFGLHYAFSENFILPLSHDEVVHGKRSILGRMPGDEWQRFANLRAYYGFMFGHPGKKLMFMGGEFAQSREWNHDQSLDWHLLEYKNHPGVQSLGPRPQPALSRGAGAAPDRLRPGRVRMADH